MVLRRAVYLTVCMSFLKKHPINIELWLMIHRNIGVKCTCVGNLVGNASKSMTDFKKRLIEGIDEYVIKQM